MTKTTVKGRHIIPRLSNAGVITTVRHSANRGHATSAITREGMSGTTKEFRITRFDGSNDIHIISRPTKRQSMATRFFNEGVPRARNVEMGRYLPLFIRGAKRQGTSTRSFFSQTTLFFGRPLRSSNGRFHVNIQPLVGALFALVIRGIAKRVSRGYSSVVLNSLRSSHGSNVPRKDGYSHLTPANEFGNTSLLRRSRHRRFFSVLRCNQPTIISFYHGLQLQSSITKGGTTGHSSTISFFGVAIVYTTTNRKLARLRRRVRRLGRSLWDSFLL